MFELFSVDFNDVVDEAGVLLMSGVDLGVVELWELIEHLSLDCLSVLIVLCLKIGRTGTRVKEHDHISSV